MSELDLASKVIILMQKGSFSLREGGNKRGRKRGGRKGGREKWIAVRA